MHMNKNKAIHRKLDDVRLVNKMKEDSPAKMNFMWFLYFFIYILSHMELNVYIESIQESEGVAQVELI